MALRHTGERRYYVITGVFGTRRPLGAPRCRPSGDASAGAQAAVKRRCRGRAPHAHYRACKGLEFRCATQI